VPPCIAKNPSAGEGGICGGTKGFVKIRFVTNNPGIWLLHCHMEWHMQQGLAVTLIENADALMKNGMKSIPNDIQQMCRLHD
jgi:iron transport multicopper oxidase